MAIITDAKAKAILDKLNIERVSYMVDSYPEEEREGASDLQLVADEAGYYLSCLEEGYEHAKGAELKQAQEILRKTQYGKFIRLDPVTFKPEYKAWEIQEAKARVNEYNRLKRLIRKLETMGVYSRWY